MTMWEDSGYAYAKAGWIIGKSFLGKRISSLSCLHTLSELDRLIFPDDYHDLPGRELLPSLERRIKERGARQILSVVNSYSAPAKLLVRLLKGFEYEDLKECLGHIASGRNELPVISDIGRFNTVRFDAFPDIGAMIKKTEYENILPNEIKFIKQGSDLTPIEAKLDYRFYNGLTDSLAQLEAEDRETASRLIADEISLRNCFWALRLRTYFQKSENETAKYLMDFKLPVNNHQKRASLSSEAKLSLDFSLDIRQDWRGWRWERFLNPEPAIEAVTSAKNDNYSLPVSSISWAVDPRHFQNAALQYLYHLCFHNFHSSPMSISAIYCFIKLMQFEEDLLTSVAEGLALGIDSTAVFKMLEHPAEAG